MGDFALQAAIVAKAFNLRAEWPEGVAKLHIESFSTHERRRLMEMLEDMVYGPIMSQRHSPPASIPAPVTTAPPVTSAASASAAPASGTEAAGQSATEAPASAAPQRNSAEDDEELRKFLAECNEWMWEMQFIS